MKSFVALALILGSQVVQAAPMDDQIRSLARRVLNNSQRPERLTQDEKIRVVKALNNANVILERVGSDHGGNRPGPSYPSVRSCEREQASVYQASFVKIKNFAYSGAGLNYGSTEATDFAQEWTRKYPCSSADQYIKDGTRIKNFAYSGIGLNYSSSAATEFAVANIDRFCVNYNLEGEFRSAYSFAYSSNGLNMGSAEARDYALERVQSSAFSCRNY